MYYYMYKNLYCMLLGNNIDILHNKVSISNQKYDIFLVN